MISYPYIVVVLLLFFFAFQEWKTKKKVYIRCSFLLVYCFMALRAPVVGADTYNYVKYFTGKSLHYLSSDSRPLEPLFLGYNWILHLFTYNGVVYLVINTLVSLAPIYYLIKKYSSNASLSVLLFFIFGKYLSYFVALRQILALALILWGIIFVLEKRKKSWYWFTLFSVLSYYIHTSSIIVVALYLLAYFINIEKRIYFFISIIISTIIGIFLNSFSYLDIFAFVSKENISSIERISAYLDNTDSNLNNPLIVTLKVSVIGLFVFSTIPKEKLNHCLTKIYLISILLYNIFYQFPMILRANMPFQIMSIIVFTWVTQGAYSTRIKKVVNIGMWFIVLWMLQVSIRSCIYPDLMNDSRMHPYYFFFEDYSTHPSIIYY